MRKITLILFYLLTLTIFGCKENGQKSSAELRMELKMQEDKNPMQYLELEDVNMKGNKIKEASLFSSAKYDGYLVTGQVKNRASIAKYKDLEITVEFYSETETLIGSESFIIYEYFEPNSTQSISLKIQPPKAMKAFKAGITGALPAY
ncbi:hypothetical protein [Gilvibacter sediminis]|uniref:hypothetical protein n=1 Tax=Gilvibacter sediminis TaxID=379071 RepID=UPI0023504508|nr:hypothetical protein [Gilvibacter sediminis]MDC7997977.1 hypothetical protein [Gilvibacter sediminis]